jgi:nucleoid DNA-binding protein
MVLKEEKKEIYRRIKDRTGVRVGDVEDVLTQYFGIMLERIMEGKEADFGVVGKIVVNIREPFRCPISPTGMSKRRYSPRFVPHRAMRDAIAAKEVPNENQQD